jgi:hypothetical protein
MLAAGATVSAFSLEHFGCASPKPSGPGNPATVAAAGYGTDPDLLRNYKPGELWPLTFTADQRRTVAALCDVIIPADDKSPSASNVGVPDFIDEWISAPYSGQQNDGKEILEGLAWLNGESKKRFQHPFSELTETQQHQICDDISYVPRAKPEHKTAANFFAKFRNLTAGGFYTTPQGWRDIQYVGNVALMKFDGPPPEVLKHVGLS